MPGKGKKRWWLWILLFLLILLLGAAAAVFGWGWSVYHRMTGDTVPVVETDAPYVSKDLNLHGYFQGWRHGGRKSRPVFRAFPAV